MSSTAADEAEYNDPPYVFRSWRSVCAVSFLVYAAFGAVLPGLSLFLLERLRLPIKQACGVYAVIPLGVLLALPIVRAAKRARYDSRLGLAGTQLVSAGLMMAAAWCGQNGYFESVRALPVAGAVLVWSILVPLATTWLNDLAHKTAPSNPHAAREWRLWGAVGFAMPAWTTEFVLARWPSQSWGHFEILFAISGWLGIGSVMLMLLARSRESDTSALDDDTPVPPRFSGGETIIAALLLLAILQRCHEFWTPPFVQSLLQQHDIRIPLALRILVVSHIFELVALYGISRIISQLGIRLTILCGTLGWVARCLLLGWISQAPVSGRTALTVMFLAQMLGGISLVLSLGPAALLLRSDETGQAGSFGNAVRRMSLVGALGVLVIGILGVSLVDSPNPRWINSLIEKIPPEFAVGSTVLRLRGWAGVWFLSAVLPLAMLPFVLFTKFKELRNDSVETDADQDAVSGDSIIRP